MPSKVSSSSVRNPNTFRVESPKSVKNPDTFGLSPLEQPPRIARWLSCDATSGLLGKMTVDLDIYRSANMLIEQHGCDAGLVASKRADELSEKGDLDGRRVWLRIVEATREFQEAVDGQTLH